MPTRPADAVAACPSLRADAATNRRRLLDAARRVFVERGIQAPLDEVARRAGVGNATLYRRFPTRAALLESVFADRAEAYVAASEAALVVDDPWDAFSGLVEQLCAMQAEDGGLRDVLMVSLGGDEPMHARRERIFANVRELVRLAQAAGQVRADLEPQDLVLLLLANGGILRGTQESAPTAWRRFLGVFLDGCRPAAAHPLLPAPEPNAVRPGRRVNSESRAKES